MFYHELILTQYMFWAVKRLFTIHWTKCHHTTYFLIADFLCSVKYVKYSNNPKMLFHN
jgi:hypothetical protein